MLGYKFPTLGLAVAPMVSSVGSSELRKTAWDGFYYLMMFLVKLYMI
jgi:hypothetical protein